MPASPPKTKIFEQDRAQFTYKWKAMVTAEFRRFCHGKLQNFANWAAEFEQIFIGKLWALDITYRMSQKNVPLYFCPYLHQKSTDFQNSFTGQFCRQLAIKWLLNILPNVNCVTTLQMQEKLTIIDSMLINRPKMQWMIWSVRCYILL